MYNDQTKAYVPTMLNSIYLNQPNSPYSESSCESHYADSPYFDGLSEMQPNLTSSKDQAMTDFFSNKEKLNDSFYDEVLDFNDCEGEVVMNSQDTVRIVNFRDSQSAQDSMHVPAATFNGDPNLLLLNKKSSRSPSPVQNLHYLGEQYDELVYPELGGLLFPESETPSAYYSSEDEYCAIFDSGSPLSVTDGFSEEFDECDETDMSIQKSEEAVKENEAVQEWEEKQAVDDDNEIKGEQVELEDNDQNKKVKQEDEEQQQQQQQQQSSARPRTRKRKTESSASSTATTSTTTKNKTNSNKNNSNKRRKTMTKATYQCPICNHVSVRKYNMTTHIKTHDKNRIKEFTCFQCQKGFDRRHDRDRHLATVHRLERSHACEHCTAHFSRADALERHLAHKHGYDVED